MYIIAMCLIPKFLSLLLAHCIYYELSQVNWNLLNEMGALVELATIELGMFACLCYSYSYLLLGAWVRLTIWNQLGI